MDLEKHSIHFEFLDTCWSKIRIREKRHCPKDKFSNSIKFSGEAQKSMQELQLKTILVGKLQIQTFEKHWQNIYNKPRVYFYL